MKPKRIFQVYAEHHTIRVSDLADIGPHPSSQWRWRLIAVRNGQVVAGSQETFDSRSNALRAARREASFFAPGTATVEVAL